MKENNCSLTRKFLCVILSLLLLIGLVPVNTWAVETGSLVLVVETKDGLVIAPEFLEYTYGESVGQVLQNSGHTFSGIENEWITEINGVGGNYIRGDEDGSFDLSKSASEIQYYRFCEEEEATPSEGLQALMTAMAVYKTKDADVKAAAKDAYDQAYSQFVGLDSDSAAVLAKALNDAMANYENIQAGTKYEVAFKDGTSNHSDVSITVTNDYGKTWTDDGDGVLNLPVGDYAFCVNKDGLWAEGEFNVSKNTTINAPLPKDNWLLLDAFRLSGSYDAQNVEDGKFDDDEYKLGKWNGRTLNVGIQDTFVGRLYTYAEYDKSKLTDLPKLTAIYTSAKTGEEVKEELFFESFTSGIGNVLSKGATGNRVVYRISYLESDGYTYSQDYTINCERVPSLAGIEVKDQKGVDQAATMPFDASLTEYTYKVLNTVTKVVVKAEPLVSDYSVLIDGKDATKGVELEVNETGATTIDVEVKAGKYSTTYKLDICPGEGKEVNFITKRSDITLKVVNQNGQTMPCEKIREGADSNRYKYALVPGETYSYVATADTYYHVADEFTMEETANSTINVDVPTEDWLIDLAFGTNSSKKGEITLNEAFVLENHHYEAEFIDTEHIVYVWATSKDSKDIKAIYKQKHTSDLYYNKEKTIELSSGSSSGAKLDKFLMNENPIENTLVIRVSQEKDGVLYYQDYDVDFKRQLTLKNLTAKNNNTEIPLVKASKDIGKLDPIGFNGSVKEYNLTVSMEADTLELYPVLNAGKKCYGESEIGYTVEVDGKDVTESTVGIVELNGTLETQLVKVTVKNDKALEGTTDYIINILKSPPVKVEFKFTPNKGTLAIYETMSGERIWPDENNAYSLCEGYKYEYKLTYFGYIAKTGVLDVTRDEQKSLVIKDDEALYKVKETPEGGGTVSIEWTLEEAPVNDKIHKDMAAIWPDFRGNKFNNAVVSAPIPTSAEEGTLYWANKIGEGYSSGAVGSPILVDGDLVTYSADKIYRVDTISGKIKATGNMISRSAHATTPPSYADGMIFVALIDGTVQAFNAKTLESLWIFKDPLGGQPVCPLTISNGYLYTGFWNQEKQDANFVCISITDEDPTDTTEEKEASWYYTSKGGYYWAGAFASSDYVIVGTDDGTNDGDSPTSRLLLFDPMSGKLLDSIEGLNGDIRSTVVYDEKTDAFYFTSKGGSFYSVKVKKENSTWKFMDMWSIALQNGTGGIPMSTCSPAVYNGRAYVGVSGEGQFGAYSGHNITVIDLNTQSIAYSVPTQGYPQTSGLLTTAYKDSTGYVYVYFFDNMTPGKLRVLRDKSGQTSADYLTVEEGLDTAYDIFAPTGDQAQYAICSPITDEYGTIYFKNDSGHLMAFGSAITKIEVTKNPDKTVYEDGELFDSTGMVVTATYANGKTRDITDYVTIDLQKVTSDKSTATIVFPYVMYHNEEYGTSMESGVTTTTPVTTLNLTVKQDNPPVTSDMGDVNKDGTIDTIDASLIISYYYSKVEFTEEQLMVADVNRDGVIDTIDASLIISYYYGKIDSF